jgi:type IV secretion system protein TrbG
MAAGSERFQSRASMWNRPPCCLTAILLGLAACARTAMPRAPAPAYLRATPIVERGETSIDVADATLVLDPPGDDVDVHATALGADASELPAAAGMPSRQSAPMNPVTTPTEVIAQANASAVQGPQAEAFVNAIVAYEFQPGNLYKIYAAPENVTEIVLEPGEEIMGQPTAGDTLRWQLGVNNFAVAGVPQQHVFLKPTRAGLATNLTVNTSRRTYYLQLESVEANGMIAVQWHYADGAPAGPPAGAAAAAPSKAEGQRSAARPGDGAALNFDYSVEVVGGKPRWIPQAVYDDGHKTFVKFDGSVLDREIPALYVRERDELQLVNYRVHESLYIVDRLFDEAELRLGQEDQDIVRLRNRSRAGASRPTRRSSSSAPRRPGTPI